MAARRFGALDLSSPGTNVVLMSGTAGWDSSVNVRFTNRNSAASVDAPAATALTSLTDADWIEYDTLIQPNEVLEDTGVVVPENYSLVVSSDTTLVSVVAYGWEEQKV